MADFHPLMTLADARGKILFMIREDYKSSNNGRYFGAYLNWTDDKVVFDTTLSGNGVGQAPIDVYKRQISHNSTTTSSTKPIEKSSTCSKRRFRIISGFFG